MAIRPVGDVLVMETMLFADEVPVPERLEEMADSAEVKTTKRERDIAKQLVNSLAGDFDSDRYRDTYREQVLGLIERKAQGEEITAEAPAAPQTTAPDLMSALQASLDDLRSAVRPARAVSRPPQPKGPRKRNRQQKDQGSGGLAAPSTAAPERGRHDLDRPRQNFPPSRLADDLHLSECSASAAEEQLGITHDGALSQGRHIGMPDPHRGCRHHPRQAIRRSVRVHLGQRSHGSHRPPPRRDRRDRLSGPW